MLTIVVVCSRREENDASRCLSDAEFFSFDESRSFWMQSSSSSTRVNSVLMPEVVEVASDCVLRRVLFGVDGGDFDDWFGFGKSGLSQSDPFGSLASLPVVIRILRCLFGGSRCGSVTMDTNVSVPSVGKLRLRM